jgi:DNA-binding IclR family transcriptional regulator
VHLPAARLLERHVHGHADPLQDPDRSLRDLGHDAVHKAGDEQRGPHRPILKLAVREGTEATLVERLSAHQATPVQYRVGGRLPLHSTAVGLVLLAFAPSGVQEDFLARPMYGEPDHVLIPPEVMRRTLADVRRERLAIYRRQEQEVIVAVAAPIFGADDSVAAALGVLLPERVAPPRRLGLAVRTAAQGISRELGARQATSGASGTPPGPA